MSFWGVQATLAQVLLAHKAVLGRHGMLAAEDTRYYRLVVALSLRPEPGWWDKLHMQHASGGPLSHLRSPVHASGGPVVEANMAPVAGQVHQRESLQQQQAAPALVGSQPTRTNVLPGPNYEGMALAADKPPVQPHLRSSAQRLDPAADMAQARRRPILLRAEAVDADAGAVHQDIYPVQGERWASSSPGGRAVSAEVQLPYQQHHEALRRTVRIGDAGSAWVTAQPRQSAGAVRVGGHSTAHSPRLVAEQADSRERVASWLAASPPRSRQGGRPDAPWAGRSAGQEHAQHSVQDRNAPARRSSWRSRSGSPPRRPDLEEERRLWRSQARRRSSLSPAPGGRRQGTGMAALGVSAAELRASYAAWQAATQRLVDIGHVATQRRHWASCRRAFQVSRTSFSTLLYSHPVVTK